MKHIFVVDDEKIKIYPQAHGTAFISIYYEDLRLELEAKDNQIFWYTGTLKLV